MNSPGIYIIKSVFIATIYFGFYWFFLRNSTFYKLNRLYLLFAVLQAVIVPLFRIESEILPVGDIMGSTLPTLVVHPGMQITQTHGTFNLLQIGMIIYISGVTFLMFRFINNLARIMYFYLRFPKTRYKGFNTVVLRGNQPSFTFFNTLFISENDLNNEDNEVVLHEIAHCRQWHSFDVVLLELIVIIQWFNPLVWLYRSALKSQHEYAADNYVLEKGFDLISYQQLLFERAVGFSYPGLINHFNHSLLKKRLFMLTKNKSKAWHRIHYWISLPMMLFMSFLFIVQPDVNAQESAVLMHDQVDQMPEYPGGIPAVKKHIAENILYPEAARDSKVSAKIFVSFVVDENGKVTDAKVERTDILEKIENSSTGEIVVVGYASDKNTEYDPNAVMALENEAVRVIQSLGDWKPGKAGGKNVKVQYTFPIQFMLQ